MMSDRPLLLPLISMVAGCLAQYLLDLPVTILVSVMLLGSMVCLTPVRSIWLYGLVTATFWASLGMFSLMRYDLDPSQSFLRTFDNTLVTVEGVVAGRPVALPEGQRIDLTIEQIDTEPLSFKGAGRLLVTVGRGRVDWLAGDRIRFPARIKVPRVLNLPGEFNYPRYLALHGYHATAWVKDAGSVVLIRGNAVWSPQRLLDDLALRCQQVIRRTVPQPEVHGILIALATGTQHEIPAPLLADYTRAGVNHILSVSGFHVGIVTILWVYLLRWLLLRSEWFALRFDLRRCTLLSAVPIMVVYLLFTGSAWATARAVLMLVVIVLALWFEREVEGVDALAAAAFLLVLFDPGALFDPSFQLSCMALWGLVILTPFLMQPFERCGWTGWKLGLLTISAASTAAMLATVVPALMIFHQTSLSGIVANIVIVPLLGYAGTVVATAAIPVMLLAPWASDLLLIPASLLVKLSNLVVGWIAQLPVLKNYAFHPLDVVAVLLVFGILSFVRTARMQRGFIGITLVAVFLFHLVTRPRHDGRLHLHFLSVGQAESILITLPDSRTMLIDGGGYLYQNGRDFGERYLVPALHRLGVRQIDMMVLTHPHPDHLGGLPAVAEQFKVGAFWRSGAESQEADYQRLMQALIRQKTVVRTLQQGEQPLADAELKVLVCSVAAESGGDQDDNEASLVLRLQYRDFSALLMADAGVAVEQELIRQGARPVTLLKVGHHGSKTATSVPFLKVLQPQLAVISAGADNRFRLPAPETVERLRQQGVPLYRTDLQGTIRVSTDGTSWTVGTFNGQRRGLSSLRCFFLTGTGCWDNN